MIRVLISGCRLGVSFQIQICPRLSNQSKVLLVKRRSDRLPRSLLQRVRLILVDSVSCFLI